MNRETGGGSRFVFRPFIDLFPHPNNPHFFDPKTEIVIPKKISYIEIHFKNKKSISNKYSLLKVLFIQCLIYPLKEVVEQIYD